MSCSRRSTPLNTIAIQYSNFVVVLVVVVVIIVSSLLTAVNFVVVVIVVVVVVVVVVAVENIDAFCRSTAVGISVGLCRL